MSWIVSVVVAGLMAMSLSERAPLNNSQQPIRSEENSAKKCSLQTVASPSQQDRIDQTYPLNANGKVSLNNVNGTVVVEAWDKSEARVEAVKTIDCDKPYQIDVNIDSNPNLLQIETEYQKDNYGRGWSNNNRCREARVDYKLTLPRTVRLDEIETVNGNITLSGMTDFIKASTVNGRINASNLRGTINLSSVNGTLEANFESLENVREVKMGMVNGKIDLQLPSDIEATLKADTVNGSIANDFGLPVRKGEYVGRNLYGRLGNGSIPVKLDGVNGSINIRRKQDGRVPKSAINLLPAKDEDFEDDDDDDDDDEGVSVIVPRMPKPPRAPSAPRTPRAPRVVVVPRINVVTEELVDDEMREDIRKSVEQAHREAAKIKIDQKELQRQIREGMKNARRQMSEAFNFNFNDSSFMPMSERETRTFAVEGKPRVTVNAPGGRVSIRGWDRAEVSYSIARRAASAENSAKATVSFDKKGSEINLSVPKDASDFRLEIYVPRNCNLRVTSNRQIRVEGVKGELKLDGGDESINVRDASGSLSVRASEDSNVRIIGFDGDAEVKGGNVALEGNFSRLDTDTTGTTILTLPETSAVMIEATTESVVFEGLTPKNKTEGANQLTVWRLGDSAATANYKMQSAAGEKIIVRSLNRVRVTHNYLWLDFNNEIYS